VTDDCVWQVPGCDGQCWPDDEHLTAARARTAVTGERVTVLGRFYEGPGIPRGDYAALAAAVGLGRDPNP
jgi:hypothetical protein